MLARFLQENAVWICMPPADLDFQTDPFSFQPAEDGLIKDALM